jgi:hypothetical protein
LAQTEEPLLNDHLKGTMEAVGSSSSMATVALSDSGPFVCFAVMEPGGTKNRLTIDGATGGDSGIGRRPTEEGVRAAVFGSRSVVASVERELRESVAKSSEDSCLGSCQVSARVRDTGRS